MAAVAKKQTCPYGNKCYRKNKQHIAQYHHENDDDEDKPTPMDTSDLKETVKPRLVHDISNADEDDVSCAWKKGNESKKRKASPSPSPSKAVATSPSKKAKFDDSNVEKIAVDFSTPKKVKTDAPSTSATSDSNSKASTSKVVNPPKPIQYKSKREKCKYWDKCYQTSDSHRKEYCHPDDDDDDDTTDDNDEGKKTRNQSKSSLNPLEDGGTVDFDSGYKLERDGDIYSCTCKGFLVQKAPINERTCKHLKEYLGEAFEKARIQKNAKPRKGPISSHINISVLLANKYDEKKNNPVGWWISEKLDGVRAYWNGRCFYSRLGNAFYAPEWFTKDLPKDMPLDGELFGGRGQFQSTVSIVKTAESPKWKDIQYYVFDGPRMGKAPFEERMNKIKEYFEENRPKYAVFVEQTKCVNNQQLDQMLTKILNIGGEGLMIREPKSMYEATRSHTLLKIKKFYDAEAIVIGHEKGKGMNQHRCGALRCRMECGKEFSVGSGLTNKDRNSPPKIGSIITYKFQELSKNGIPRFPTYLGIRIDMTGPKDAEIRPVLDEDEA